MERSTERHWIVAARGRIAAGLFAAAVAASVVWVPALALAQGQPGGAGGGGTGSSAPGSAPAGGPAGGSSGGGGGSGGSGLAWIIVILAIAVAIWLFTRRRGGRVNRT